MISDGKRKNKFGVFFLIYEKKTRLIQFVKKFLILKVN